MLSPSWRRDPQCERSLCSKAFLQLGLDALGDTSMDQGGSIEAKWRKIGANLGRSNNLTFDGGYVTLQHLWVMRGQRISGIEKTRKRDFGDFQIWAQGFRPRERIEQTVVWLCNVGNVLPESWEDPSGKWWVFNLVKCHVERKMFLKWLFVFCLIFCKTQQPTFFFRDTRKPLLKIAFFFHTKQVFFGRFSNGQRSLSYFRGLLQAKLPLSVTEVEKKKLKSVGVVS